MLARNGHWIPDALRREGVRQTDMEAALRRQNAYKIDDVDEVKLEPGGTIVVDLRPELESATKADVERLEAKLDRLLGADHTGSSASPATRGSPQADDRAVRGWRRGCTTRRRGGGPRPARPVVRRRRSGTGPRR